MAKSPRRHDRVPQPVEVIIGWTAADGSIRQLRGKCVDLSESGMQVECLDAIDVRSYVVLKEVKRGLEGSASVRHCIRQGIRHRIGLEFSGGMRYQPKASSTLQATPE